MPELDLSPEVDLNKVLAGAADEVLCTMFFSMLEEAPPVEDAACTRVRVGFRGHATGTLTLSVSPEAIVELTANFLGIDGEAPPAEQEAMVKELANMICGAVLSRLETADVLHLMPPEVLAAPESAAPQTGDAAVDSAAAEQLFGVGAGFLRLQFQWDGAR